MFDEEKFDKECKMLREYSEGLDKGIESERNRIKNEIKQAIEKIFNVHVKEIRTINVKPKKRRVGRYTGLTNRCKKAIVKLAEGEEINLG